MVDTQSVATENRRGKKEEEETNHRAKILHRVAITIE